MSVPTAIATPSQADELITKRLIGVPQGIDVRVLDHWIIAADTTVSFAEEGRLSPRRHAALADGAAWRALQSDFGEP